LTSQNWTACLSLEVKIMNNDTIKLIVPNKKDYLSIIRLTASAIASKLGFNIEELEDVKVLIGEANIITLCSENTKQLEIEFKIKEKSLEILIKLDGQLNKEILEKEEVVMSKMIIESLSDEVDYSENSIRLTKLIN
jgi:serine/threonine-protein kinase RsbW